MMRLAIAIGALILVCGCGILPQAVQQPEIHNPFPQLTKVAIAPFFNLSAEPTVDGRQFGAAYFAALQSIPGFEVVPVGVTEQAMRANNIQLNGPEQARQLAQILGVDAVVIGAVTDFSPYYPPRCGLQVEWYAANPGFHPVPPGYGLPWGTTEEEYIPPALRLEAEMALARKQLATQTPDPNSATTPPGTPQQALKPRDALVLAAVAAAPAAVLPYPGSHEQNIFEKSQQRQRALTGAGNATTAANDRAVRPASAEQAANCGAGASTGSAGGASAAEAMQSSSIADGSSGVNGSFPPDWPDPRGFVPAPPSPQRPPLVASNDPVMRHARIYMGNDSDFTTSLENFSYSRDDARKDGWQGTLQRSDDFIRFCCYKHIAEMLTARGGAGEARVVYRWDRDR